MICQIERLVSTGTATIPNGTAFSDVIDMRKFGGGVLSMPAEWDAAAIGFHHCHDQNGTFQPLKDSAGAVVGITATASGDFVIPDTVFACAFIKLWSQTAGSNVNQAAERSIIFTLKS